MATPTETIQTESTDPVFDEVVLEVAHAIETLRWMAPNLQELPPHDKNQVPMLPTADAGRVFAPVIRRDIRVCEATRTRWLGNGYVVFDRRKGLWKRNINITDKYIPVTDDLRTVLMDCLNYFRSVPMNDRRTARLLTMRAQASLEQTRKSAGSFRNIVSTIKPMLIQDDEFFIAQTIEWMLTLTDQHGEIVPLRMSQISDMNTDAGHIGGVDWDKTVAKELWKLGVVVKPGNRPTVRLDKDSVRSILTEYVEQHSRR